MENQTANWKALGMEGDCLQTEIDGWRIEATRDGERFWVVGEDGYIDTFAWCDYMEGYELEFANGVTDPIPQETWERIEEAIARLRDTCWKGFSPCDS